MYNASPGVIQDGDLDGKALPSACTGAQSWLVTVKEAAGASQRRHDTVCGC